MLVASQMCTVHVQVSQCNSRVNCDGLAGQPGSPVYAHTEDSGCLSKIHFEFQHVH